MTFEREDIYSMQGYVPGEQPSEVDVVKLNTNENPYPASAKVAAALASITVADLRRYPSPSAASFRRAAARLHGVSENNIIATNGGDELLRLAITTFAGRGDTVGIAVPSYSLYPVLTGIQGCHLRPIPLSPDWKLPGDFATSLNKAGAKLALLVNPHAPSGLLTDAAQLLEIAQSFKGVLLVDEAYVDFVDQKNGYNLVPGVESLNNLLILRTLSKGYSMAGLRFGYGIGSKNIIEPMMYKTKDSYNTDFISQKLAVAALESVSDASQTWSLVRSERERLALALGEMKLPCFASQSNFLLVNVGDAQQAKSIYRGLKEQKILVRYFDEDRLRDKLRITVGTVEQNQLLLSCLSKMTS